MQNTLKKLFVTGATIGSLALQGCTTPYRNEEIANLIANNVVRMNVYWGEYPDRAWAPASYNVLANYNHWNDNSIQYRWIQPQANMRRDIYARVNEIAIVPDEIPFLNHGDLVDVYIPPFQTHNYAELRAPVVIRLVCKIDDKKCLEKSKKELSGINEIVSKGAPDMSKFTFTKKFDKDGKRLPNSN